MKLQGVWWLDSVVCVTNDCMMQDHSVRNKQTIPKTQPVHNGENYSHLANQLTQSASHFSRGGKGLLGPSTWSKWAWERAKSSGTGKPWYSHWLCLYGGWERRTAMRMRKRNRGHRSSMSSWIWSEEDEEEEEEAKRLNRDSFCLSWLCNNPTAKEKHSWHHYSSKLASAASDHRPLLLSWQRGYPLRCRLSRQWPTWNVPRHLLYLMSLLSKVSIYGWLDR